MYGCDLNHIFHREIPECLYTQQPVKEGIDGENPARCSHNTFMRREHPYGKNKRNSNT